MYLNDRFTNEHVYIQCVSIDCFSNAWKTFENFAQ
jgi:hypothetical protein